MTRPKLTADAWVRTWVTLCEIHGAWTGIRNTSPLNFFSLPLLFIIPSLFHTHPPLLPETVADSTLSYPPCWSWGFNLRPITMLVTEKRRLCHCTVLYVLTHTNVISGRKFWTFSKMVLLMLPVHCIILCSSEYDCKQ
jgi:hypothetical protein